MRRLILGILLLCGLVGHAEAQGVPLTVLVVPSCGVATYTPTQNRLATMDITGRFCTSGTGGGGGGGVTYSVRIISSGTTDVSTSNDGAILWLSASTGGKNESLFACNSTFPGKVIIIKDEIGNANTYPITVTPVSGTIDSASFYIMNFGFQSITLTCDGASNWVLG